ncbi:MAG: MinD/ParA family protein, partial [Chloroflexi bacterium]|nr:MinD/ParA family protein [Chloroflexota bacterium]
MSKIISVHSYRGGTGKSTTTANLGALLALNGHRVGVVDTDIQSPGIHVIFGMDETPLERSLNDYLWGRCAIEEAAYDVTAKLIVEGGQPLTPGGMAFLIPSSIKPGEITQILRDGYDVSMLNDGFRDLVERLNLDFLLIDTHPGLNEETLLS